MSNHSKNLAAIYCVVKGTTNISSKQSRLEYWTLGWFLFLLQVSSDAETLLHLTNTTNRPSSCDELRWTPRKWVLFVGCAQSLSPSQRGDAPSNTVHTGKVIPGVVRV